MSHAMLAKKNEAEAAAPTRPVAPAPLRSLRIGEPNDAFEQKADRIADAVMAGDGARAEWSLSRTPVDAPLRRKCACGGSAGAEGVCEERKKKNEALQRASLSPREGAIERGGGSTADCPQNPVKAPFRERARGCVERLAAGAQHVRGLRIRESDDAFEKEAERVADTVMAGNGTAPAWSLARLSVLPPLQRKCACGATARDGGERKECKERMLQRQANGRPRSNEARSRRPPGEGYDRTPRVGGLSDFNPNPRLPKSKSLGPELSEELGDVGAAESLGVGTRALARGSVIAVDLVLLVTTAIWELIVPPNIQSQPDPQEARLKSLKKQVQRKFDFYKAKNVERLLRACCLPKLIELENSGKPVYVNVLLNVVFADTSHRWQPLTETVPESVFDIEVSDLDLVAAIVGQAKDKPNVGPMTRCELCGDQGYRASVFGPNEPRRRSRSHSHSRLRKPRSSPGTCQRDFKEDDLVTCSTAYATKNSFIAPACTARHWHRRWRCCGDSVTGFCPTARTFVRTALVGPLMVLVQRFGVDRWHAQRSGPIGGS